MRCLRSEDNTSEKTSKVGLRKILKTLVSKRCDDLGALYGWRERPFNLEGSTGIFEERHHFPRLYADLLWFAPDPRLSVEPRSVQICGSALSNICSMLQQYLDPHCAPQDGDMPLSETSRHSVTKRAPSGRVPLSEGLWGEQCGALSINQARVATGRGLATMSFLLPDGSRQSFMSRIVGDNRYRTKRLHRHSCSVLKHAGASRCLSIHRFSLFLSTTITSHLQTPSTS